MNFMASFATCLSGICTCKVYTCIEILKANTIMPSAGYFYINPEYMAACTNKHDAAKHENSNNSNIFI